MAGVESVKVEGLQEFAKALRTVSTDLSKELRAGFKSIADLIAQKTAASFEGGEGVVPKVAPSVKALAQQSGASLRIGGPQYPFAMGAEFGALEFPQFPAWRGSGSEAGYHLYPAIRDERAHIDKDLGDLIERVASKAFPD